MGPIGYIFLFLIIFVISYAKVVPSDVKEFLIDIKNNYQLFAQSFIQNHQYELPSGCLPDYEINAAAVIFGSVDTVKELSFTQDLSNFMKYVLKSCDINNYMLKAFRKELSHNPELMGKNGAPVMNMIAIRSQKFDVEQAKKTAYEYFKGIIRGFVKHGERITDVFNQVACFKNYGFAEEAIKNLIAQVRGMFYHEPVDKLRFAADLIAAVKNIAGLAVANCQLHNLVLSIVKYANADPTFLTAQIVRVTIRTVPNIYHIVVAAKNHMHEEVGFRIGQILSALLNWRIK